MDRVNRRLEVHIQEFLVSRRIVHAKPRGAYVIYVRTIYIDLSQRCGAGFPVNP